LIFKGSGFYITDYRSNSYNEGAKKEAPPAPVAGSEKSALTKEKEGGATAAATAPAKGTEAKPKQQSRK
jgi:hypothetical protein